MAVKYVDNIRRYYDALVWLDENNAIAPEPEPETASEPEPEPVQNEPAPTEPAKTEPAALQSKVKEEESNQ